MDGQNQICWVCFPQRDGMEPLQGELAAARRRFFADPKHTVSIDKAQSVKGFGGHLRGKLSRRHFYWKKKISGTAGGEVIVEEAFGRKDGWVLVTRDMYGVIVSRGFFDKKHQWLRTEYYEPWDSGRARVSFSPGDETGAILRRDWDPETKHYHDTMLYQVPYRPGTAGQSVVDAQIGEPQLLLALSDGEVCCCPKEEADARLTAMKNVNSGTVVLMPAWEIKGGELVREDGGSADITFTSLEEYAKIEPGKPGSPQPALTGETLPAPEPPLPPVVNEFVPEKLEAPMRPEAPTQLGAQERPEAGLPFIEPHEARHMQKPQDLPEAVPAPKPEQPLVRAAQEPPAAPQPVNRMPGPGAMPPAFEPIAQEPPPAPKASPAPTPPPAREQPVPAQTMEGPLPQDTLPPLPDRAEEDVDLESILAEAAMYSNTPPLPEPSQETSMGMAIPNGYTGDIKNGKISGRGRTEQRGGMTSYEGDYVNGKREGFGAYYYKDGNLCYAGSWRDDRRDGLGVSFRDSDHALHVANWKDGQPSGLVTLFDSEGNLRYSGRMENGKKEGAGVVINGEDGTVFVGQWAGGETTGLGSAFDREGRLLYYGSWKDGKRHGHGTEFDMHGGVVFDGEFRDGKYFNGVLYQKL